MKIFQPAGSTITTLLSQQLAAFDWTLRAFELVTKLSRKALAAGVFHVFPACTRG